MSQSVSNIKVFPSFAETAFFSGEEFSCILTFKNVAEQLPSSSSTSLTRIEEGRNESRIVHSKFAGAEWMADSGRSASEGPAVPPRGKRPSPHARSLSTVGKSEDDRSRPPSGSHKIHGRSNSVAVSTSTVSPSTPLPLFETQNPFDFEQMKKSEGLVSICTS